MPFDVILRRRDVVSSATGLEASITNWGEKQEFHVSLSVDELGVDVHEDLMVDRNSEGTILIPVGDSWTDQPRGVDLRVVVSCERPEPPIEKRIHATYLPEGWFDMTDPSLAESICGYAYGISRYGNCSSAKKPVDDLYESMRILSLRNPDSERYVYACDPDLLFSFGDGTPLDAAVCFLCSALVKGTECCLMILGSDYLVGIGTDGTDMPFAIPSGDREGSSFVFYNPSDALRDVPLSVSMDRTYARAKRMMLGTGNHNSRTMHLMRMVRAPSH